MKAQMRFCGQTECAISKHHKRSSIPFSVQTKFSVLIKIFKVLLSPAYVLAISNLKPSSELTSV